MTGTQAARAGGTRDMHAPSASTHRTLAPAFASWWLAAIVVATVLGFLPTVQRSAGPDRAHAIHGLTALTWSLLLVAQAWLAEQRRREWHRQLAVLGIACAIALVATAMPMLDALASAVEANAGFRPIGTRLLVMDVLLLVLFVLLFAVAMASVRRPAVHARALAATGLLALPAGAGRAYMRLFAVGPVAGSYLALGTAVLIVGTLIYADRRAGVHDRVHPLVLLALVGVVLTTECVVRAG